MLVTPTQRSNKCLILASTTDTRELLATLCVNMRSIKSSVCFNSWVICPLKRSSSCCSMIFCSKLSSWSCQRRSQPVYLEVFRSRRHPLLWRGLGSW